MRWRHACLCLLSSLLLLGPLTISQAQEASNGWTSLTPRIDVRRDAVAGTWQKNGEALTVAAAQGARLALPAPAAAEYDLRISFTRQTGQHSIGVVVLHGGRQVAFEVDAWGMHLAGFQNVGGQTIQSRSPRGPIVHLENQRRYSLTVEVRRGGIRGLLDDREIARHLTDGSDLSVPDLWSLPNPKSLGLLAWDCNAVFHSVELRTISATTAAVAGTKPPASPRVPSSPSPAAPATMPATSATSATAKRTPTPTPSPIPSPPANPNTTRGKRVVIVVANHHFFYREYADPRAELERAGIQVAVAAGEKSPCRPHSGSGEGGDGGVVQPDLALADVRASDFDAVLFSGGWGASMYQFAFTGRYTDPAYNGNRAIKVEANRIVNEFLSQGKYACALCNATSVLAWARVNGKSPLAGKRVCAPMREAPTGVYNGRPGQPPCRWHATVNGANVLPPGSVGQPGTAADDVVVDGQIITGEDDISAREMGRRIVEVLSKS